MSVELEAGAPTRGEPGASFWRAFAWSLSAIVAASVCASLLSIPIQTTDSLISLLDAQSTPSVARAIGSSLGSAGYLRPLRIGQIQGLFELSHGHYFLAFKGFHVALVIACVALFVVAARIRSRTDCLVLSFALTVLMGMHTFLGTVWEAYPINHFLEIVVLCLMTFVLTQSKGGWWADLLAASAFVVGSLTLESGLLVWVVIVAAWMLGMRGVSTKAVVAVTVLLAGYLGLRFGYVATGLPSLMERSTGFGLSKLDPADLVARFGQRPYILYAYNVACSFLSVPFSQPRAGVWTLPAEMAMGRPSPATVINIVCSTITTLVIVWFAVKRSRAWRQRRFEADDRIVLVGMAVLIANAVLSYGYTKDEIMSPAGAFYALAAYAAVRRFIDSSGPCVARGAWAVALTMVMGIASVGWSVRAVGLHYQMHQMAMNVRNEWVHVDERLVRQNAAPVSDAGRRLVKELRTDAIEQAVANPYFLALQGTVLFR